MTGPVRYKCRMERPFPDLEEEFEFCEWEADEGVKAVKLDCEKSNNRYVLTRNMDNSRAEYPWRVSRFDLDSGEPYGHAYGKNPAHALNEWVAKWEKCKVTAVRTVSGEGDFGRPRFEKLTKTPTSSAPSHEARRVIGAFLRGEAARGACKGKGSERTCAISSDGRTLKVSGSAVATRDGARMTVCVPAETAMERRGRKSRESEEAKDVRVTASVLLRRIAGVGVRNSPEGQRLLAARGKAALLMPGACVIVRVPKREALKVLTANTATEAAKVRFKTEFPSHKQVEKARQALLREQRMVALTKAQAQRRVRVGPAEEAPFPEEEFVPGVEQPEAPFPEAPLYPEPEEAPYEDETFQWEAAQAALPTDVEHPTDPESYTRFVNEYLPKLRKGAKRDMALAWQAYLLDPKGTKRPGATMYLTDAAKKEQRAAREVELEIADEYGIVDPIRGYTDPADLARSDRALAARIRANARRAREGKGRKVEASADVREHMRKLRAGESTGYKRKKAEKAAAEREIRKMIGPGIRNLKDK